MRQSRTMDYWKIDHQTEFGHTRGTDIVAIKQRNKNRSYDDTAEFHVIHLTFEDLSAVFNTIKTVSLIREIENKTPENGSEKEEARSN